MFPNSWISFGVLHGIALMLIIVRLTGAAGGRGCGRSGCWRSLLPRVVGAPVLRHAVDELGRPRHAQAGHRGLGAAAALAGRDVVGLRRRPVAAGAPARPGWPARLPRRWQPLALLGRWSLSFYMLHQPAADRRHPGGRCELLA